jgi:hypothetical protein
MVDFRRAQQRRIGTHVASPVETDVAERDLHELADGMTDASGDDVVIRLVLLQHQPHRAHVVAGIAPVALRVEIAERQMIGQTELDPRHAIGHFARHELQPAAWRLVVEQDAGDREHVVAFAVVHRDVVAEHLRHAVRAARIERRQLGLRHLAYAPVHLARRRLVDADVEIDLTHRLEEARHTHRVVFAGQQRLVPRCGHERHRRQVVQLVGPHVLNDAHQRLLIQQISRPQRNATEDVLDAPEVRRARSPHDTSDFVSLLEEQLREVRTILAGDAGNQCAFSHAVVRNRRARGRPGRAPPRQACMALSLPGSGFEAQSPILRCRRAPVAQPAPQRIVP